MPWYVFDHLFLMLLYLESTWISNLKKSLRGKKKNNENSAALGKAFVVGIVKKLVQRFQLCNLARLHSPTIYSFK